MVSTQPVNGWHWFHLSREQADRLQNVLLALSNGWVQSGSETAEGKLLLGPDSVAFVFRDVALVPSLFRRAEGDRLVGFTENPAECSRIVERFGASVPAKANGAMTVDSLEAAKVLELEFSRLATVELLSRVHGVFSSEEPLDLEGEALFEAYFTKVTSLLMSEYLEFQPESPADFWPGKSRGWVWQASPFPGQVLSVLLTPAEAARLHHGEAIAFISDASASPYILNHYLMAALRLRCGVVMPLGHRGFRFGLLKLFYSDAVSPTDAELEAVGLIRTCLSTALDRSRKHLRTQRMAMIDGLTNLFNHRFFRAELRTEFHRARRYHKQVALIMIDIDDFKVYNDRFGHLAGDRVLAEVARTIRKVVRDIDFVARYGGEEFALILPEINSTNGMVVAEKIRGSVEAHRFFTEEGESIGSITVSCGVTDNEDARSPEELIERADRALYWVKRHGRNLVRVASAGTA